MKVLVAEPLAEEGIALLSSVAEVVAPGTIDRQTLLDTIGQYDALIVRSATKVDKEVIDKATNLKVIGRAGVGLDNIDVEAATRKGVVVVNAPQSNILSAAEHTMGLLLAMARNIPAADASLKNGQWERDRFTGVELHGKTLGVLGLGRIGTLVAQRASAFGMRIVASDPYVSSSRASQMGIELMASVEELCAVSDFITVHMPKTSETKAILGEKAFAAMKPGARIINAARGGIVDEDALLRALKDGRVAAAALDVFEQEPPGQSPLVEWPTVVVTPHLGASTEEAQTKAGMGIAEQVTLALKGEFAPFAVNIQGGAEYVEMLKPFIPLAEKVGSILNGLAGSGINAVHFEYHGTVAEHDTRILTLAGLKGLFLAVVHEPVTYVNAPLLAADRGLEVKETRSAVSRDYVNLVLMRAETDAGSIAVGASLVGKHDEERIVRVFDYTIDMLPERYMLFMRYADRPGVIGKVGTVLGDSGVNIASMQVSRENIGGEALMGLTVDSAIPPDALSGVVTAIDARDAKFIDLGP
ncbi:MAG: phosphoglycerate dehydrogenase [Actinobacteria bacterium]|nr:phosphoglycerate dehydrogenase [Actinomycetota bacterium]